MSSTFFARRLAAVLVCALSAVVLWGALAATSASALITPVDLSTPFNRPIGLQYYEETKELLLSVNYETGATGGEPYNFDLVNTAGADTQFTAEHGLKDEIYMAAIRNNIPSCPAAGHFSVGEVFSGNGKPGGIERIDKAKGELQPTWLTLPGETGLLRGGIAQGCAGPFSGDLVVTTTAGDVWLVTQTGFPTYEGKPVELAKKIAGDTFEGPTTIPNEATYGPWAGKILVASEGCGCVESVEAITGAVKQYTGYATSDGAEGIHVVPAGENFYASDYADGKIIGIPASELVPYVGEVFVYTEIPGTILAVHWNSSANGGKGAFEDRQVIKAVGQLEGSTFAPIGIDPICEGACELWYSDGKPIEEGKSEKVKTSGKMTFLINGQYPCATTVTDEETIINPAGGGSGTDEVTSYVMTPCKKAKTGPCPTGFELVAQNLPWKSHLLPGTPEPDPTEGIDIAVKCHGEVLWTYTGTLTPLLGDSTLTFSEKSGELREILAEHSGEFGSGTLVISGTEKVVGPKGDTTITSGPPTKNVWNIEKTQTISWGKLTFKWSRTANEGVTDKRQQEIETKCREQGYVGIELENCTAAGEERERAELAKRCEEEFAAGKYKSFEECLKAHESRKSTVVVTCKKSDAGNIWNSETGQGLDETVLFDLYECSSETCPDPTVTASRLPWQSTLEESPRGSGVIRDHTMGMLLSIECQAGKEEGAFSETFTGELSPRWRNGSKTTGSSYDEFGEGSGALSGEPGNQLTVTGDDYMAGFEKGELITASTVFTKEKK